MANNTGRVYLNKVCAGSLGGIFSPKPIEVFQSPRQALLITTNASRLLAIWEKVFRPSKLAKSKDTTFHKPSRQLTLDKLHREARAPTSKRYLSDDVTKLNLNYKDQAQELVSRRPTSN